MSKAIFQHYLATAPAIALDAVSQRMLHTLARQWASKKPITVLKAMAILPEISTTTAHRRLTALRELGYIDLEPDAKDNRVKYVVPTKVANKHFEALGAAMKIAVQGVAA